MVPKYRHEVRLFKSRYKKNKKALFNDILA